VSGRAECFKPKYTAQQWRSVKADIFEKGMPVEAAAKKHGMVPRGVQARATREGWAISEHRALERSRAKLGLAEPLRLERALALGQVKEVELELAEHGERLRKCGVRTRLRIAELVEAGLEGLKGARGVSIVAYSRALAALAAVGKIIHGWDREPVPEPMGAINLPLMRMTPALLRERWEEAQRRRALEQSQEQTGAGREAPPAASEEPEVQERTPAESAPVTTGQVEEETDARLENLMRAFELRRDQAWVESRAHPSPQRDPGAVCAPAVTESAEVRPAPKLVGLIQEDRWRAREETRLRMRENPFR
jgi:hypothetical protein